MESPRKPTTQEKLDLGYEIIEQLLLHQEPLTDDQIDRYVIMWVADRRLQLTYYSRKLAYRALIINLEMVSGCGDPERVPIAIIKALCCCSRHSVHNYNRHVVKAVKAKVLEGN
jgi:hypothetical protein